MLQAIGICGYALLSLTVIRVLPVALSLLGTGLYPASFGFVGWLGPRGLASVLFVVVEEGNLAGTEQLESVVMLSAFLHGATTNPFAGLYSA